MLKFLALLIHAQIEKKLISFQCIILSNNILI